MTRARLAVAALALLAAALPVSPARACGVCDEDTVAAAYDHALVERALAGRRQVVFCALQAALPRARADRVAARVGGVVPGSVRVSAPGAPAALAFVLDARVQSAEQALAQWRAALGAEGKALRLVRVLDAR